MEVTMSEYMSLENITSVLTRLAGDLGFEIIADDDDNVGFPELQVGGKNYGTYIHLYLGSHHPTMEYDPRPSSYSDITISVDEKGVRNTIYFVTAPQLQLTIVTPYNYLKKISDSEKFALYDIELRKYRKLGDDARLIRLRTD
jgi:hypothetical protein